ncbi:Thioredoxin H2 [Camellia lanceoleosa]|uniref:Thioredoxin H2 n=1 Tax=Camellia lanceoleosa TaxID=1840588 RepID=A0ACC0G2P8_9ERIC|nr:Thioredoxin H2 [Camellia lanceoleosa]
MGAELSAMQNAQANGQLSMKASSVRACQSQVLAFHSSARWRAHFEASKATAKLMVIDFTASWCVPCRFMEPTINEFAAKYTDVEFIKIDVDELMIAVVQWWFVGAETEEVKKKKEKKCRRWAARGNNSSAGGGG